MSRLRCSAPGSKGAWLATARDGQVAASLRRFQCEITSSDLELVLPASRPGFAEPAGEMRLPSIGFSPICDEEKDQCANRAGGIEEPNLGPLATHPRVP